MAQTKNYEVTKDSANGSLVFNGQITLTDLMQEPTFTWMAKGIEDYQPNQQIANYLQQNLPNYTIVIFLGTWCDDSHYWIPKLIKLLQTINYPSTKLTIYGVDRAKATKTGENIKYGIKFVPTIILLKDGKEAGRITESPQNGLEADMEAIIKK